MTKTVISLALTTGAITVALYLISKPLILGLLDVPDSGLTTTVSLILCALPPVLVIARFLDYRYRLQSLADAETAARIAAQGTSEQQG